MNTFNPFEINICRDLEETPHLHTDVELLYVIEGSVKVQIKETEFILKKDDVIVVNSSIQHKVSTGDKSIICSIKYDYQILVHILKKPNSLFLCNSSVDKSVSYYKLQKLCREVIYEHVIAKRKTDSRKYALLYELLDELVENFVINDTNLEISDNYDADEKLQLIIHYVHQNYQDGISLSDLAKQMYTSTSTLSRLFKKQTGNYFAEYVNQVRTRYAINELLYTEKNMTRIAMDCGFSNASAFTKVFREIYNMAPTEYRAKKKGVMEKAPVIDEDIVKEIGDRYESRDEESDQPLQLIEGIIDVTETTPLNRNWSKVVNIGFIHDVLNANVQYHVTYLKKELNIKYGRLWMIFNSKTMVTDGVTVGNYNFDIIFQALDFMVENNITPWLDFTSRPYANVKNSEETVWFESLRIPFENPLVWEKLFLEFVRNIVRRYGLTEVSQWKFEFGLESFHNGYDEMFSRVDFTVEQVFAYFIKTIKTSVPQAEVGYSGGAGSDPALKDVLSAIGNNEIRPDFVSYMLFPYHPIIDKSSGVAKFDRAEDSRFELHELERINNLMKSSDIEDIKIYVSEWNITVSNSNFLNDSTFRAAVFLRNIVAYCRDIEAFGLWMSTDWLCNSFTTRSIINGGGGILTKDTIRKPIYYAIRMLNHMGSELIAYDENYLITRQGPDEYQIMCFNPVFYGSNYFVKAENNTNVEEIKSYFDMNEKKTIRLILDGVSDNMQFYVKRRSVNSGHGSIIDEWGKFDNDLNMDRSDVKYLQEICVPVHTRSKIMSKNGKLVLEVELEAEEFCALHVYPAY